MIALSTRAGRTFQAHSILLLLAMIFRSWMPSVAQQPSASSGSPLFSKENSAASRALVMSGKLFQPNGASLQPGVNVIRITAGWSGVQGTQAFSLHLPADADRGSLRVTLNGNEVSDRFQGSGCGDGTACASGTLTAKDGLSATKNVLTAVVKNSSGFMASGRWRSMAGMVKKNSVTAVQGNVPSAARVAGKLAIPGASSVCDPVNVCPAWLPPTVRFDTLALGGVQPGTPQSWVRINGQTYGMNFPLGPEVRYLILMLNDQTLEVEDIEPCGDNACVALVTSEQPQGSLVVMQTVAGNSVGSDLDASVFGGTNFTTYATANLPAGYMAIGVTGQPAGTAYENTQGVSYATGSLVEDVNGNYGFQSSDIVEYAIQPQDAGDYGNPTITLNVPPNLAQAGEKQTLFEANAGAGQNGLWLLTLSRANPMPPYNQQGSGCSDNSVPGLATRLLTGCGTFYPVGDGSAQTKDQAWQNLAAALSAVKADQLVFLQSIGSVGSSSLAQTVGTGTSMQGFRQFAAALQSVGGTPMVIAGPKFTNQDTYAFVGFGRTALASGGGGGGSSPIETIVKATNALTGGAAEVSTAMGAGQSGVLHGTLQRDGSGLYRPSQTSAELQGLFTAKGSLNNSDFTLSVVNYQQPVEWPSNSGTTLLPGATSISGQQGAYRFISHWLLANYYLKGIQGVHQDDLHFFFSGSTNTSLDYHVFDPANLPLPAQGTWANFGCTTFDGTTCTFQAPGDSTPSSFTTADFAAVKMQVSQEVTYLTNTLQYLATGSTNLKDVVASGSANVGLALSAAANTVLGSGMGNLNAQQLQPKPVTFSWQQLLSTLAGIASVAADAVGVGEVVDPIWDTLSAAAQTNLKRVTSTANTLGAIVGTVGAGASIDSKNARLSTPQPFAQLTTTVGELASNNLQSPLILAFDTMTDRVTSDWGRLSTIGPRVVNTNDPTFFAPNQLEQYAALNAMTSSSTRTFYSALLPQVYNLHFWAGVGQYAQPAGSFIPAVGSVSTGTNSPTHCYAFYVTPNDNFNGAALGTLASTQGISYPSMGGGPFPFSQDPGFTDVWVIDGGAAAPKTRSTLISVMNADLANNLFSANQLNVPMAQMFSSNGPMANVTTDAGVSNSSGWASSDVCDPTAPHNDDLGAAPSGSIVTTTTLVSPMSGVLGKNALFTASVTAGKTPVTSGSVYFRIDGTALSQAAPWGADGTASSTVAGLALGQHTIGADYSPGDGYGVSSAPTATFTVYSEFPDLKLSIANSNLNVSYGAASAPLTMQISSVAGLAGDVTLSCSGLPHGMACSFGSNSLNLASDGSVTASMQIRPTTTAATAWVTRAAEATMTLLLAPLVTVGRRRKAWPQLGRTMLAIVAVVLVATTLNGCSGAHSNTTPTPTQETGSKTILVNAQVGSISRSVAVNLNIQ